ncbi:SDR family NAD(P)-dependent oxidoreductase [Sphingopyxis macrogoltabida]|uniref:SDR family NAD(P)-dependent oxidoreductase n=1 Tax=Sphingopyxis macrogoltabida TaxID=33050 RepID=UPI0006ECFF0A|nr:SDR family oxidoreductase [Sphingopyxis macrogoltabida]ALJ16316.1 hypothetical protein LH19_26300 [Sphingopyxis macrogoltabida]
MSLATKDRLHFNLVDTAFDIVRLSDQDTGSVDAGVGEEKLGAGAQVTVSRRLFGKVAIVTGAGAKDGVGVGAATAITLAREGCRIVLANRDPEPARRTAALIDEEGGACIVVAADIGKAADCTRVAELAAATYQRIDILVNNAAVSDRSGLLDLDIDRWDAVLDVNLKGTMMMTRAAAALMPDGGTVINISSRSGERPLKNAFAYATSKGAIIALTRTCAVDLGPKGIRVNALVVGGPWTPMAERAHAHLDASAIAALRERRRTEAPIKREGSAWDVAKAALFFASDDSSWITGQALAVDGGYLLVDPSEAVRDAATHQDED